MRTNQPHAFLLLLYFAACSVRAARLPVRHYTTADGLARNSVHGIIRDRDGFLWFATGEGISRFDGYSFTNYRRTDGLPDRDIWSIVQTADGSFLVATGGGAVRFRPAEPAPSRRFQVFALPGGVLIRSVKAVIERRSTVWIGTDGGLYAVDRAAQSPAVPVLLNPGGIEPGIATIVSDPALNLWVGTSNGLFVIDASDHAQRIALAGSPAPFVDALLVDTDGVWLGTGAGALCKADFLKPGNPPRIECPAGMQAALKKSAIKSLLRARDGSLWIGTVTGLARQAPDSPAVQWLGEPEGFLNGNALALAEDGDGDVWVGYDGPGVLRVSASGFVTYDGHDGLPPSEVAALAVTPGGALVVTTSARPGLSAYRFEKSRFQRYELGDDSLFPAGWLPWHQVLAADSHGSWWTGSKHGLLRFPAPDRPGPVRRQSVLRTANGMPADDVAHVLEDSRGNIWFSTLPIVAYPAPGFRSGFGVWERSTGRIRTFWEADGLPPMNSFSILQIAEDHTGQIWIGLYQTGVARLRQGRFQVFTPADGIPAGGIRFIYEDREHRLWLGSGRGGLGCIADPSAATPAITRYTMADGLSSDEIQAITEDNFGRIYLGTGLGVDRLDPATRGIVHYTAADGLAPGEVEDAVRDSSGDLWFGTYQAVSRLHPRPDPLTRPLPAKVSSVRVNGQAQPVDFTAGQVRIADVPPGSNSVQMDYFAFALSGTENIRYQYRLTGADKNWSEPNLARTTLYSNLRPGSYAFQVRCLNPLPGDPATVRFTVLPHIWERWWFVSLGAMAFLGALYAAHSYRLANIVAMQNMRTRLARDLHDDIGSGLSKIVILSEVARRGNGGGPVPEALDHIAESSREVLDAVGDLVWATHATAARIEDLIPRMRSFASQLFEAQGVEFELRVSGAPSGKPLSPEALRQLYLIFKEAVNNAAKHSRCTRASAELRFEHGWLTMLIADNGIGFTPHAEPGHHGLASLEARSQALGGKIAWHSENGTTITLSIPCSNK